MMRALLAAVAVAMATGGAPAAGADEAQTVESFRLENAGDLVVACTAERDNPWYDTARGFCLGYMTGAMQFYGAASASPKVEPFVCPDGIVPRAEMRSVFLAWADAHPELLAEPAIDGLVRAAVGAYPCG